MDLTKEIEPMGHAHWSLNCACCSAMGIMHNPATPTKSTYNAPTENNRINTNGFEHIYVKTPLNEQEIVTLETLETYNSQEIDGEICEEVCSVTNSNDQTLLTVIEDQNRKINEQTAKLEAASYRIGYLEALVKTKEEEIALLPDRQAILDLAQSNSPW